MEGKTCKNCGHRYNSKCMLSGYSIVTERRHPIDCGNDFKGWIMRDKKIGLIKWFKNLIYGES